MNGQKQVLVGRGANHVGNAPELERPERRRGEVAGEGDLEGDDGSDEIFGKGLGAAELGDLGLLANSPCVKGVDVIGRGSDWVKVSARFVPRGAS